MPRTSEFSDNFNRADSSDLGSNWSEVTAYLGISNNTLKQTSSGDAGECFTVNNTSSADCYTKAIVGHVDGGFLTARMSSDNKNGYFVNFKNSGGSKLDFYRKKNGSYTSLGTDQSATFTHPVNASIEVVANGANADVKAYADSTLLMTKSDTSPVTSAGRCGVRAGNTNIYYDDFECGIVTTVTTSIKKYIGVAQASVKKASGVVNASCKKILGVANV